MRLRATLASLMVLVTAVGPATLAAAAATETCEASGVRYNCVTERIERELITPRYDNGMEGTVNASNYTKPWEEWPTAWAPTGVPVPRGVVVGGLFETPARLFAAYNGTAPANASDRPFFTSTSGYRTEGSPAVRLYQFTVHLNATQLMSGSSEWFYRSPIKYDDSLYLRHYLTVKDEGGRTVVAKKYDPAQTDPALTDAMVQGDRLYYHVTARLDTNADYSFIEYVETANGLGLGSVDAYLSPNQDVDQNGKIGAHLFPGENAARVLDTDLAYSFRFIYGQGPGGTMNLLTPDANSSLVEIATAPFPARNASSVNNKVLLVVPIRTTFPLDLRVSLTGYNTYADAKAGTNPVFSGIRTPTGVAGSIVEHFSCECTPAWTTNDHYFVLKIHVENFASSKDADGHEQHYISYPMFTDVLPDGQVGTHVLSRYKAGAQGLEHYAIHPVEWTLWAEVVEDYTPAPVAQTASPTGPEYLMNPFYIIGGLLLFAVAILAAPISIPLAISATIVGSAAIVLGTFGPAAIKDALPDILATLASVAAVAACGGAALVPNVVTKLVLGGACALLAAGVAGGLPGMLQFVLEAVKVVRAAVELVGQMLLFITGWLAEFLGAAAPWIKGAFVMFLGLTAMWFLRELILWILNLLWPFVQQMRPKARGHHQRFENTVEAISIPIWDSIMYWKPWRTYRGRYWRQRFGGNPE